jgi:steroid delta-isomerase-like uncharacterized protein
MAERAVKPSRSPVGRLVALAVLTGLIVSDVTYAQSRPASDPVLERNRALVRRWIEDGFNKHDVAVVDELFRDGFAVNGHVVGRDGIKASMTRHLRGFPDLHVTIEEIVAEGDKVGIWYTVEATHRGEFDGVPPTGRSVRWTGSDLMTIQDGRISEARFLSDSLGLLKQLGMTLSPSVPK